MIADKQATTHCPSYWKIFRFIFVIFSLYLLRDVFNRWDGFRYHSTFSEFLPSVALVTVLWSMVALFTALIAGLLLRAVQGFSQLTGRKINTDLLLMFIGISVLFLVIVWVGKQFLIKEQLTPLLKLIAVIVAIFSAVLLTWRFRNKSDIIHDSITPLVGLFGIWVMVSLTIVVYHTWLKQADKPVLQKVSQTSITDTQRPNIILVTFDAMTSRDMSVYGYHRPTTPFINKWSKTGYLFKRVESSSNWTVPSVASLMTGKRVWTHRTFHEDSTPFRSDMESLPLELKKHGYYNMAFVVNPLASTNRLRVTDSFDVAPASFELARSEHLVGWKFGFLSVLLAKTFGDKIKFYNWILDPQFIFSNIIEAVHYKLFIISQTEVPPEIAFNKFLVTLDEEVQGPYFAWIHLLPPHDPYLPPETYSGIFDDSANLRTYNQQRGELKLSKITREENWGIFRARYDEFITYCDKTFEDFMVDLTERDKLINTVIIFSSDHGESFEHNDFTHGHDHLYEQVTHIPLIIKLPDQGKGVVINDLTEQIDITPTILSLANIQIPSWMEGRSLMPLLQGAQLPSKPAFSMNLIKNPGRGHQITKGTISVWEGDYKLIHYLDEKRSLLFNLNEDPDEIQNLINEKPLIGQNLLSLIQHNLKEANERIAKVE